MVQLMDRTEGASILCQLASHFGRQGWLPATAGNLSVRVEKDPTVIAITRSGCDKQQLQPEDVIFIDRDARLVHETSYKPSAETIVHTLLYDKFDCGCVLHVHSVANNVVSNLFFDTVEGKGAVPIANHELLKALDHWEEGASIQIPIVENFHDLPTLGRAVEEAALLDVPGVLVRNHGIYAWGKNAFDAKRYLEAFEFLFQYLLSMRQQLAYD